MRRQIIHLALGSAAALLTSSARAENRSAMKPGQLRPNEFEVAVLQRISDDLPCIRPYILKLHVLSREFTGVGSYTNFAALPETFFGSSKSPISLTSGISMPGVANGMGAMLFFEASRSLVLETFTFADDFWDGDYTGFSLQTT
ncbi:hypothetical protein [Massilia rubra]|uniref:Uncharacterized protein n=1 Tax=Massilia rubra TaxID=2607910 RepID=A0ABX0LFY4_9BURK|nr:hypothetical protein [Massilia rubra]NHZ32945.1 hypothetical protein [Massilia rubra]